MHRTTIFGDAPGRGQVTHFYARHRRGLRWAVYGVTLALAVAAGVLVTLAGLAVGTAP